MMTTKETGSESGRDTRMCGDPKAWFPMRVTYQREMKVKAELDRLGIENFVPMRYKVMESQNDGDSELRRVARRPLSVLFPLFYFMDETESFWDNPWNYRIFFIYLHRQKMYR
jgi:hypothetical protein